MKWGWLMASAILPAGPLMAADHSPFDGIPGIRFEYYEVEGRTPREIYQSMEASAPRGGEGLAQTIWGIDVNWHEATHGSVCRVRDPRTRLSIRVVLPKLRQDEEPTRAGLAFWRATRKGLEIHEAGHARIAWDHRDDFNQAALSASCRSIDRVAREIQAKIAALQEAYDRDTDHGRRQTPGSGD